MHGSFLICEIQSVMSLSFLPVQKPQFIMSIYFLGCRCLYIFFEYTDLQIDWELDNYKVLFILYPAWILHLIAKTQQKKICVKIIREILKYFVCTFFKIILNSSINSCQSSRVLNLFWLFKCNSSIFVGIFYYVTFSIFYTTTYFWN